VRWTHVIDVVTVWCFVQNIQVKKVMRKTSKSAEAIYRYAQKRVDVTSLAHPVHKKTIYWKTYSGIYRERCIVKSVRVKSARGPDLLNNYHINDYTKEDAGRVCCWLIYRNLSPTGRQQPSRHCWFDRIRHRSVHEQFVLEAPVYFSHRLICRVAGGER